MKLLCASREGRIMAFDVEEDIYLGSRISFAMSPNSDMDPMRVVQLEAKMFQFVPSPGDNFEKDLVLYEEVIGDGKRR